MTRAERYMLQAVYPKTNLDRAKIIPLAERKVVNYGFLPPLKSGEAKLTLYIFVIKGKHRMWSMHIGRSSRRYGIRDTIAYYPLRSEAA